MFSSIITPTNLTEDSRLISILLKVIMGNLMEYYHMCLIYEKIDI